MQPSPDVGTQFFETARQTLVSLSQYGFIEGRTQYDTQAFGNALLELRSPQLRIHFVRDRSQLFVTVAPAAAPEPEYDLALLAEWLGSREAAAAVTAAMPPLGARAPAEPETSRIRILSGILRELMPELLRTLGGPGWAESVRTLDAFARERGGTA